MNLQQEASTRFAAFFGSQPDGMVKSPGRVCLIGEHTDYNQGFVLPFALDLSIVVLFRINDDTRVRVRSLAHPDYEDIFDLAGDVSHGPKAWANYIRGVFYILRDYGFEIKHGLDLLITSTLPEDAGLASSGAMSTAVAGAIRKALNIPLDKRSLALISEKAENEFLGRHCGIMDPLTAMLGKENHLLLIDCHDYSVEQIPYPNELAVIIFNSMAKMELEGHEFNDLRKSCEDAALAMGVDSLRRATLAMLSEYKSNMSSTAYRRAYHIITENERTKKLAKAFLGSNFNLVFQLMNESQDSLKENFGNTTPEIDALVDFCREELGGNIAARMTGGGFGGSVVAVCERNYTNAVINHVSRKYFERFNITMPTHICRPADGMRIHWNKN